MDLQPIYFLKVPGQTQDEMTLNTAPISSGDFLPTILELTGEKGTLQEHSIMLRFTTHKSIFAWEPGDMRERTTSYLHNGLDTYRYTGDRDDLTDAVEKGILEHTDTVYDWD